MIQIKLWGGLCNQMFQYSFGYVLSKKKKDELCFDLDFYNKQPKNVSKRTECLRLYFPKLDFKAEARPKSVAFFEQRLINHVLYYHFNRFRRVAKNSFFFKEKHYQYYSVIPYKSNALNYYDGYWQSELYFKEYSNEIRNTFTPSDDILDVVHKWTRLANEKTTVALHVRRGDLYGKNGEKKDLLLIDYFKNSIHFIKNRTGDFTLFILSDDIEWCRNNLSMLNDDVVFVDNSDNNAALVDLFIIACCDHGIMSRSTFSWWGNWLGDNRKRIVVAPAGVYFNTFFIPDRWHII